jgi:glycosyltransferase involved in cell wall biosynthesis
LIATRKLLSIGHSYVINLNRRLIEEIARLGEHEWEIAAVAPHFMRGDLRSVAFESSPELFSNYHLEAVPTYLSQYIHVMTYSWQLREILQRDWHVVHCWEEPYILAGAQVAWWTPPQAALFYYTFQNSNKHYPPPFSALEQFAIARASGWICSGQTILDALSDRPGYNIAKRLIPLGVDTSYFYPNPFSRQQIHSQLDWPEQNPPVIGFLGRFVPEKGIELLMRVIDRLPMPWRALFIGSGPLESALQAWAQKHPGQVRICTDVKHDQVPQYLNGMDVLCAPSQTAPNWREQFGRMMIEAFACGVPVIGSDSGEIPYVLAGAGLVVGEKDEDGWVQALSNLLQNPAQRQEMAERGLDKAHTVYAWPAIARQHLEFFEQTASKC